MEEIKVNEYVRTIDGYIRKVTQVNEKGSYECLCWGAYLVDEKYKNSVGISAKKIAKHSFNIIDLIEEGDYIKLENRGERFYEVTTNYQGKLAIIDIGWNEYEQIDETYNDDIKSIITKEMMKSVEYKVD